MRYIKLTTGKLMLYLSNIKCTNFIWKYNNSSILWYNVYISWLRIYISIFQMIFLILDWQHYFLDFFPLIYYCLLCFTSHTYFASGGSLKMILRGITGIQYGKYQINEFSFIFFIDFDIEPNWTCSKSDEKQRINDVIPKCFPLS